MVAVADGVGKPLLPPFAAGVPDAIIIKVA
jgi:hypothetical protein